MLLITIASEFWPQTAEGRVLCFILSLYAFGVFGYVTATLASFFVGRDAANAKGEVAGTGEIKQLQTEIRLLRAEIRTLSKQS
jgi:voltage-gated potassium channel